MGLVLAITLAIFFWGIAPVFGKAGLVKVDPLAGLAIRTFTIALILMVICLITGKFSGIAQVRPRDMALIAAEGICASLLGHFAYYYALKLGDASKVAPMIAAYPVVTVVAAVAFLGEKFTWNKAFGLVAIVVGLIAMKK